MLALIDSDVLVYRVGFTTEDKDEKIAFYRLDEMIKTILRELGTKDYKCFLTSQDHSCFRYDIEPNYKANRKAPKPLHYLALREYLIEHHPTEVVHGMEADDALGINQTEDTVIVSIDKDLRQIPGKHYHFVNKELYEIDDVAGIRWFYKQILIGDRSDGIEGLRGVGPVRADKYLDGFNDEYEMYQAVKELYGEEGQEALLKAGQLLKIKRTKDEPIWQPPSLDQA